MAKKFTRVVVFDLDNTAIDSDHRTPNNPDGTLNLEYYFKMKNRENTFKDTLLPLAKVWKAMDKTRSYIVICTARTLEDFDFEFLDHHGLYAHKIMGRTQEWENYVKDADLKAKWLRKMQNLIQFQKLPFFMFEDSAPVLSRLRKEGVTCINSIKTNKKLMKSTP